MDKGQRREKRKVKDRERFRLSEGDSYRDALMSECRQARRDYSCLFKVVVYEIDPDKEPDDEANAAKHVPKDYKKIDWEIDDGGSAAPAPKPAEDDATQGGESMFFRTPDGKPKAAIFIRKNRNLLDEHWAAAALPVFFHELGHVDDFSKALHLKPDAAQIDLVSAEAHAHVFACRRLYQGNYLLSLSYWIAGIERRLANCGVPNVEKAARLAMANSDYTRYRKSVDRDLARWNETFSLAGEA